MLGNSEEEIIEQMKRYNIKFEENSVNISTKLRQLRRELEEWAELGKQGKLKNEHFQRMLFQADSIFKITLKKEL